MDIRQLEAFVYTAKYQSFSLAAQKLYLSQPTVSSHICNLEKELHTQLLQRTTKTLSMTPAGRRLYSYAAEILDLRHKAILELTSQQEALLHIGVSSVPSLHLLPELLAAYHVQAPEVRFRTSCSDSLDVIRKVSEGGCDIGLAGTKTAAPGCGFLPVTSDELVLAAPNTPHFREYQQQKEPLRACCASRFCCARTTRAPSRKRCTFCGTWGCRSTS
ncbi:MAG: LysR family transcriptional regulator [Butyricicoccaceae bacterium]